MRALIITEHGGPEVLKIGQVPDPEPGPGQIRVRVRACAINRADILQRRGFYPAPLGTRQDIPGLEYAGEVEALGPGTLGWSVGDRVMGLVPGAGCAQKVVVHAREAIAAPEGLDWAQLGAIPEAFMTAYDALLLQAGLRPGQRALIHAVGSGVGTAAVQLARWSGAQTFGTARSDWKLERCKALGLDVGIDASSGSFLEALKEATGGQGVDCVLDLVGGSYVLENLDALVSRGTIITVGLLGGGKAQVPLRTLMRKRLTWLGTVLRARPIEEKITLAQDFAHLVSPAFATGALVPVVDKVFPIAQAVEAHRHMESNASFGKIVLTWDD